MKNINSKIPRSGYVFSREKIISNEEQCLSTYAAKNSDSGKTKRQHPEEEDAFRTAFQRDRDRIIHAKSFRRLKGKTQVFIAHYGDHFRTRLSHSLEVAQIARDISRTLGLNEDLSESIALAHDLGHTPFGHAGEESLNDILSKHGMSFEHNQQSRKIVEKLEIRYQNFPGLNLTKAVIDGLSKHQTFFDNQKKKIKKFPHLEAEVVNVADEIAYLNHDVDDGLASSFFSFDELEELEIWRLATQNIDPSIPSDVFRARAVSALINFMILDIYGNFAPAKGILFSEEVKEQKDELRQFLYEKFYMEKEVTKQSQKGQKIIEDLFNHFLKKKDFSGDIESIKDFIAGMTDDFAENYWEEIR